jgi:CubicO group peptidase (beta-lactamase class C family)
VDAIFQQLIHKSFKSEFPSSSFLIREQSSKMKLHPVACSIVIVALSRYCLAEEIVTFDTAVSNCPPLGAVLPPPKLPSADPNVQALVSQADSLKSLISLNFGNATGVSVAIGSVYEAEPLLDVSYTPLVYNTTGTHTVDGDTFFRIGSVSKVFTVMGLLLLGDKIRMADPITKYVPELTRLKGEKDKNAVTAVDWDLISLDALTSQLAGVPYNCECSLY